VTAFTEVPELLTRYGELTSTALAEYLAPREPINHLHELIQDYPTRGGRMLRSTLCLSATVAMGAELEKALPAAVAIELLHNAFLIHDDIEDSSDLRRGTEALHKIHGIPLALNAGDALSAIALEALINSGSQLEGESAMRLVKQAQVTIRTTVEGQAMELGWRRDNNDDLSVSDYLTMIMKKTCSYTTVFPLQAAAIISGERYFTADDCVPFGIMLGCAFQIQDDLLNLLGDEVSYGKEMNGDLYEGKRTLMLIHLLNAVDAPDKARILNCMGTPREERSAEDVEWIVSMMGECGSLQFAREQANQLAGAAQHEGEKLAEHLPDSEERDFLLGLSRWVIERN
jgi:geranylgeranyl diphosphate synthase type II